MTVFNKFKKSKNLKQLNSLQQYSLKESKLKKSVTDNWLLPLIILYGRGYLFAPKNNLFQGTQSRQVIR